MELTRARAVESVPVESGATLGTVSGHRNEPLHCPLQFLLLQPAQLGAVPGPLLHRAGVTQGQAEGPGQLSEISRVQAGEVVPVKPKLLQRVKAYEGLWVYGGYSVLSEAEVGQVGEAVEHVAVEVRQFVVEEPEL